MKINPRNADAFLRRLDPGLRVLLLYGPDAGLVRERAALAARQVVPDPDDPFRIAELTPQAVARDAALLADEMAAMALTGGRRLVRVRGADDTLSEAVRYCLEAGSGDSLLLLEADALPARSALRALLERMPAAAAIACYQDDSAGVAGLIRDGLRSEGVAMDPDAQAWMAARFGNDRHVTRGEIAKLALLAGPGGRVTLADAMALAGDGADADLSEVAFAAAEGRAALLDAALERAYRSGTAPVGILRAVQSHFQRLQVVAAQVAAGQPPDRAMAGLRPPVFFKLADRFKAQLRMWPLSAISLAMAELLDAEITCKTTGMPGEAVCRDVMWRLSAMAGNSQRRGGA